MFIRVLSPAARELAPGEFHRRDPLKLVTHFRADNLE
jgi:hypothetical protein